MYPSSEFLRCSMAHCQGLWRMRPVDALGRASPLNIQEDVPTLPRGSTGGSTGSASKTIPELAILCDRANVDGHSKVVDGRSKASRPLEEAMGSCLHVAVLAVKTKPLRDLHALPPIGLYAFRVAKGPLVPQAITASRGFARREGASQIYVGRVDIEYHSQNWRPYSFHTQYAFQEREPSPHAPNMRPYPRSTRSSQANTACGHTQHAAAPCHSLIKVIRVNRAWSWLYGLMFTVQPGADTRAQPQAQR
jgi:hypothetical protein